MSDYTPLTQETLNMIAPVDPCEYDDELMHIEESLEACINTGCYELGEIYKEVRDEMINR